MRSRRSPRPARPGQGEVRTAAVDLTAGDAVEGLAAEAVKEFGRIDGWINNAGVYAVGRFEETPPR